MHSKARQMFSAFEHRRECTLISRCELVLCGPDGRTLERFIDAFD